MFYLDKIYGRSSVREPVILELINSSAIQRLKGVDQAGYLKPYFPEAYHTRFDHSLGVFLLLRKFSASLAEQISGLIHDVSHSAFSHSIDYALAGGSPQTHSHQDHIYGKFVRRTDIPQILSKYKLDVDYILDEKNFPLRETKLPDLCADRLDYSLRTAYYFGEITKKEVNYLLENLTIQDSRNPDYQAVVRFRESEGKKPEILFLI